MKLGIDLRPIVPGASGGIVPLLEGVLAALFRDHPEHPVTLFCADYNVRLFPSLPPHVEVIQLPNEGFYSQLDPLARQRNLDVLFRGFPGETPIEFPAARQVVLVPDLQHEFYPDFFTPEMLATRRASFDRALAESGAIATLSGHAVRTVREHPATRCRDVFVMSPALLVEEHQSTAADLTAVERAVLPSRAFFLYPANLWKHKNHRRVLEAFDRLVGQGVGDVELIFTGHPEGWAELARDFPHLPVRHLGFVRRAFLQVLLQRARALVFFSLFEGFGMPLLEAFHAGAPVACSNTTSLPEVGGDAVLSCDPTDPAAMCELMRTLLNDADLRARLVARGKARLGRFTWEASARNLLGACQRVAGVTTPAPAVRLHEPEPLTVKRLGRAVKNRVRALIHPVRQGVNLLRANVHRAFMPHLGRHHVYHPRPLAIPPHYAAVRPPDPAPTISLVTPSYNQAAFLERTMRSVLDQGYPRLEYVVQDGGSWDQTQKLLDRYRDRLTHAESVKDRGQAHAVNLGFRHTRGEVMAYLNSDDLLLPGSLAYVARFFAAHPEVDVVYGHRVIIDENDGEIGRWVLPPHEDKSLVWRDYVPQETLFWRRSIWDKVGGHVDESFQFALDWDLLVRFRAAGARFRRLPRFLGAFRVHHQQKTSAHISGTGAREMNRILLKLHGREVPEEELQRRTRSFLRKHLVLHKLYRLGWLSA
jgi:glycosyltransferase involved in cell wall biosynthesis